MSAFQAGRRSILLLLAGVAALTLPGCGVLGDSLPTYRYRLTVEVETPEGLKTGSSVIEVRSGVGGKAAGPMAVYTTEVRGEAVTVDLGRRGLMFALLRSGDNVDWAGQAMMRGIVPDPSPEQRQAMKDPWRDAIKARYAKLLTMRGIYDLPREVDILGLRDNYPMLVRFRDIADPGTVEQVDPDDLARSFGEGVKLKRITVQLTDDPVTTGIVKRLGWLDTVGRLRATLRTDVPKYLSQALPIDLVSPSDFSTELYK